MHQKYAHTARTEQNYQNIEQRLQAYYGPTLPPRTLPETAWLQVRAQLDRRPASLPCRTRWLASPLYRTKSTVPTSLQAAFAALLVQTDYHRPQPHLHCSLNSHLRQPRLQTSPLGDGKLRLTLPAQHTLQSLELEVLLAVGLARCAGTSRTLFVLPRILFACALLLSLAALPLMNVERRAYWFLLVALACCLAGSCLLTWQRRAVAFHADCQAVRWLGRERVCQGLHLLAKHGNAQRRPTWGEPSLAERIGHVCGAHVSSTDKHLTLVS